MIFIFHYTSLSFANVSNKSVFNKMAMDPHATRLKENPTPRGSRPCSGSAHCLESVQKGKNHPFLNRLYKFFRVELFYS